MPTTDGELVVRARSGDRDAFADLYRRHFDGVYDFVVRMTRNRAEAADLTQDTFVLAIERLHQLRKPDSFRNWVLSIARRQTLNRLERSGRAVPTDPLGSPEDPGLGPLATAIDPDPLSDPQQAAETAELAQLVWEASASLDAKTRALLELHVRQGLESAEIAEALGVSKGSAYTMISRLRDRVGAAIGTYLLIRRGSRRCAELTGIVAAVPVPPVTEQLRRKVDRHVRSCDVCDETRRALAAPLEIMSAFAAVAPPAGLVDQIWRNLEFRWEVVDPPGAHRRRAARRASASVGIGILLGAAILSAVLLATRGGSSPPGTAGSSSSVTASSPAAGSAAEEAEGGRDSSATSAGTAGAATSPTTASSSSTPPPTATSSSTAPPPTSTTAPTSTTTTSTTSTSTTAPPNQPPTAAIRTPPDGLEANVDTYVGDRWFATVILDAEVADPDDDAALLSVQWESDVDGPLGGGSRITARLSGPHCTDTLHVIRLTVVDPDGAVASDQVSVVVHRLC